VRWLNDSGKVLNKRHHSHNAKIEIILEGNGIRSQMGVGRSIGRVMPETEVATSVMSP
jgi:hypothetical protein